MGKLRYIFVIFALLTLTGACIKEEAAKPDGGKVAISFSAMVSGSDAPSANSRALASYIPVNRTVRVIIRRSSFGAPAVPDMTRPVVSNNTYYLASGTSGVFTECTINPTTFLRTGNGTLTTLEPGYYDIYAYSPAAPTENAADTSVTVRNNYDFMTSRVLGVAIGPIAQGGKIFIDLPVMKRHCSAIAFADIYHESPAVRIDQYTSATFPKTWNETSRNCGFFIDGLNKNMGYSLKYDKLYYQPTTTIGRQYMNTNPNDAEGAGTTTTLIHPNVNGVSQINRLSTGTNLGNPSNIVYNKEFYFLPHAANNATANNKILFHLDIRFGTQTITNGEPRPLTTTEVVQTFAPGVRTLYSIKVSSDQTESALNILNTSEITDWGAGEVYNL